MTRARVPIALLALSLVAASSAAARAIDPARSTVGNAARLSTGAVRFASSG